MASAARAQPRPAGAAQAESPLPLGPSLFISPNGQPFRSAPGEPYPVARWFAAADKNGDGRIDRAEYRADAQAFFQTLDKNGDGVIDGFEVQDYEHDVVPEILGAYHSLDTGGDGQRRHGPAGGGRRSDGDSLVGSEVMGGASAYQLIAEPEPVAAADANLTGRISLADFLAAADRRFNRLDSKGLGYLTLADLPKTPVQQVAIAKARKK